MKDNISIYKCLLAVSGVLMIGTGVAFNAMAQMGNDPVGIFYDGIRNAFGMSQDMLGMASNAVNMGFIVVLWFFGRRYLNLGTLIYILPYGGCVNFGTWLYQEIFSENVIWHRFLGCILGCILIFMGIALYITVDIGVDPMTGMAMRIRDFMHWDFKKAKWLFDGTITVIGFLMGGTLGIVTVITALIAGPSIQFLSSQMEGLIKRR